MAEAKRSFRVPAELGVIFVGILLALAADAAWGARQDRAQEDNYLRGLLVEMRAVRSEFDTDHSARLVRLASLDSIRAQFQERTAADSDVARWVLDIRGLAFFFPPSAVFDDLVSSGKLALLTSDELRFALMEYQQNGPRVRFLEEREQIFVESQLRPYLMDHFYIGAEEVPEGLVPAILADRKFHNLMAERHRRLKATLRRSVELEAAIAHVVELLEGAALERVAS